MEKIEFLNSLRRAIAGVNDYNFINETIEYYQNYIESEVRKGKTEEQVLDELGDPRLIAKSIVASHDIQNDSDVTYSSKEEDVRADKVTFTVRGKKIKLPAWVAKLGAAVVGVGILMLLIVIGKALLPFALLIALVLLVIRFIKDNF